MSIIALAKDKLKQTKQAVSGSDVKQNAGTNAPSKFKKNLDMIITIGSIATGITYGLITKDCAGTAAIVATGLTAGFGKSIADYNKECALVEESKANTSSEQTKESTQPQVQQQYTR